ncbi:growth factor receptor domain-containing protein [Hymenopellis radicata]|nr:growth factor receptor domain-containing protein [Hymenopellis radicata]
MLGLFLSFLLFGAPAAANSTSSVVCVAGQCLQGFSNITLGVTLTSHDSSTSLRLLPGSYSDTTSPQLLHDLLTSSSASLSSGVGFTNSTNLNLPLTVAVDTGMIIYADSLYGGSTAYTTLPSQPVSNSSTPIAASSLALSSNVWAAVSVGNTDRVIIWESVPDVSQFGILSGDMALLDLQSTACSPSCSGNGVCSASGTCTCATGFTGSSCESCKSGFFGPNCQACPSGCSDCDDGITGSGRCLKLEVKNDPSTCDCLNGECSSSGSCTCNPGWTAASNGTACAKCQDGFFLTSTGDCKICQLGCTSCSDGTGVCIACADGFTQNANDKTKCTAESTKSSSGAVCPDGSFGDGSAQCKSCDPACKTCNGATSNNCLTCASGTYVFNGTCVSASSTGVCDGGSLIADNNKGACDTCGAKCTSCQIAAFTTASTVDQLKCTACLPGSFLSNGACIDSCPSGTFVNPSDNSTCTACDSSCSTCAGSASFCLTCPNSQLASDGTCVASCPSGTFKKDSGTCLTCHPDCATCSGGSFNECSTCPSDRPVLNNGRCLPTCSSSQFFDTTAGSCKSCDSSCSSCYGSSSNQCLSCSSDKVLRSGSCVAANCADGTSVVSGLGVCLSELVEVPKASGTSSSSPLPSITGILLMALGCAFIFLAILMLWRRRARKQRAKRTAMFASAKNLPHKDTWRYRLVRFGEKLFGHNRSRRAYPEMESEEMKLMKLKYAEEARYSSSQTIEKIVGSYMRDDASRAPSKHSHHHHHHHLHTQNGLLAPIPDNASVLSGPSIYSQVTGKPRQTPDVRQPLKKDLTSRFSASTGSFSGSPELLPPPPRTDAQAYAYAVRSDSPVSPPTRGAYWMEPNQTGGSRNPFRQ